MLSMNPVRFGDMPFKDLNTGINVVDDKTGDEKFITTVKASGGTLGKQGRGVTIFTNAINVGFKDGSEETYELSDTVELTTYDNSFGAANKKKQNVSLTIPFEKTMIYGLSLPEA